MRETAEREEEREHTKKKRSSGRERDRERELLPPYFVNKSDLQDKRSASFQLNSECILRLEAQTAAMLCHETPRGHQLGPINM